MEEKRTDIPNLSGAPYQIKHQGVMDNGTVEIHYVDANGNMMRVYGRHEETCRRQSFFERLFRRKKKPKAPKVRKEKKPKTVSKDIWDLPQPPDPFRVSKRENEFRRCRLIHQVWVVGLNTDTRRYEMDFSIFPKSVWQDPDWISMSLALEGGAWADRIFAQSFPGRGGSSRYGAEAFRIWVRNGNVTVRLPKDREGTDIWCIAYILWGQGKDFRFYTVEQTPYGIMIGLVDRDLRHYHLTPAGDGLEDTLDILEHLEIE